jgi:hypothetical protein
LKQRSGSEDWIIGVHAAARALKAGHLEDYRLEHPSPEVVKHSNHVGNVMDSLKKVDEYEKKHSKQDKDQPH